MGKDKPVRRDFIRLSAMALGGVAITPVLAEARQSSKLIRIVPDDKKLNILCLGGHPGDPEFGCGGTMARYSEVGHNVTFLYITRGEASDPNKTYAEMAALRTKEAEASCKILNVQPQFAGQIDGNTILDKTKNEETAKMIMAAKPDMVFTQWPVDGHPDHQVTGLLTLTTLVRANRQFHLYF